MNPALAALYGPGPATLRDVEAAEERLRLPAGYREFVQLADRAEGFAGEGYVS